MDLSSSAGLHQLPSSWAYHNLKNVEENTNCGFEWYSPLWLQGLASKKIYVLVYGFLGMNQTAIGSYFIGTISTIEKRFKLPSSASGLIASAWDLGALCTVVSLAYFGAGGHKARWVSACSIIAAISCYLRFLPYLLYGPQEIPSWSSNNTLRLCNTSVEEKEYCSFNSEGFTTWLILIAANIGLGVGTSTYNTLGAAYLDDNSLKDKTPFLLSVVTSLRHVGGLLGFLLASYTLNQSEVPGIAKSFDEEDPSWIGAWYRGWMPLGTVHLVLALMMAAFPKILPREAKRRQSRSVLIQNERSSDELKGTLKRLVKNPILVCNVLSATSHTFAVAGYWIFMPKYIETQFHQSPSRASLITGSVGLLCTIIGTFLSGVVITRYKPPARLLIAWSIFTKMVDLLAHVVFIFLTCGGHDMNDQSEPLLRLLTQPSECATSCFCTTDYNPICSIADKVLHFSPCHAGCTTTNILDNGQLLFNNCSCITGYDKSAMHGPCAVKECDGSNNHFTIFLILLCLLKFLSYSSRAGNIIIQYRSVEAEDKTASIAIGEFMVCGLGFIPAPLIYGLLLDWSCLIWGEVCDGEKTNCLLYNSQRLRYSINFMACSFFIIAIILDYGVFKNAGTLNIYEEKRLSPDEFSQIKVYSEDYRKKSVSESDGNP